MERVKFNTVRDAALGWVVAAAHYSNLGGQPCKFSRAIGGACRAAGVSADDMTDAYRRALGDRLTPYWMGWVARILWTDWSARLDDHGRAKRILGNFDQTEEYKAGWEDAQRAGAILLSLAPDTEYDGPSIHEIEEQLKKAGYS